MRLSAVKPGDIILAGGMHAVVVEKARGKVLVRGICNLSTRWVHADEIVKHWRPVRTKVAA